MMIQFEVRSQTSVRVDIYDVRPQRIRRLVDDVISPRDGGYVVTWNGQNELGLPVKNGYYWAVLRTDDVLEKRLLVKRRIN
jgi:flagellar hook assembly protein FlgD